MTTVAVLGAGKIGQTVLAGLCRAGWSPDDLIATVRRREHGEAIHAELGVRVLDTAAAAQAADIIAVAVKPQDAATLLESLSPHVKDGQLVVSLCAGLPTAFFEKRLPDSIPVVRAMTNTPALVAEAITVLSAGSHAGQRDLDVAEELFRPLGKTLRLAEHHQDAVTALSGSGPAYFYYLVESMTDAAILLGLPRADAHELIVQTIVGAAAMRRDTGDHPVSLRETVTSPAGTTINAVRELERHRVRSAIADAVEAARDRGRQIAEDADLAVENRRRRGGPDHEPAVDGQRHAGDPLGLRCRQKRHGGGHVLGLTDPTGRIQVLQPLQLRGLLGTVVRPHPSADGAGRDHVEPHPPGLRVAGAPGAPPILDGQVGAGADQPRLGGRIRDLTHGAHPVDRRDRHHRPAIRRGQQPLQTRTDTTHRAHQGRINDALPLVVVQIGERQSAGDTDVVDQHVQPPERVDGRRHRGLDRGTVPDVTRHRQTVQLPGGALGGLGVDIGDHDPRALSGQPFRARVTDAVGGAGEERDLAVKPSHGDSLSVVESR
ncbi:pyrroline-5-carboxylate reductase [Stackebrandtia nassauensis DSM 44728]|uniref:Pyrroline-5-carboxylate reductase n=1 Tax=Stackebrandtia nassauensis (strain DSM 44728 / CIP 108903 / NRRL B-16338 / NBRC 102104 / LLR-40K-21) TaxID=446470 RepID=D3PUG8_STANL|nr:pyrroline-5-carboxylate reductase [Stackebrandtia nassauensis]ADD42981.1 pyrroline-5-carboxylate reductase [Stackebrandtia nassauensis DSM 44728]